MVADAPVHTANIKSQFAVISKLESNRDYCVLNWKKNILKKSHLDRSLVSGGKQRLHTPLNADELVVHLNNTMKIMAQSRMI